jgi:hypothetical protein
MIPLAYATNESPFKGGYTQGLTDGKFSQRDSYDTCTNVYTNSTSDLKECYHGYDLAFKKGCDLQGFKSDNPSDTERPEYPTCHAFFSSH